MDATCPFVNKAQELVSLLTREDYYSVILLGEKEHPEVKGLNELRLPEYPYGW